MLEPDSYDQAERKLMPYIYMVRCEDRSLYTGIARDLKRRIQQHYYRKKPGAKYTRSHQVCSLEMVWEAENWSDAAKLEYRVKRLGKSQKEALIVHPERVNRLPSLRLEEKNYLPHPEITLEMCLKDRQSERIEREHGETGKAAFFSDGGRQTKGDHPADLSG